jgi:hypothetical protein
MSAPQPPTFAETPFVPQLWLTIGCVTVATGLILYGLVTLRRDRSPTLLLLVLGATVASLQEAPLDIFVSAYYPSEGLWRSYETFGRPVPVWANFAWMVLFAGAPYLIAQAMRRGSVRRVAWIGVLVLAIVDVLIEMPNLAVNLYSYYGGQPMLVAGFPMHMLAVNANTMMGIAVAVYLGESRLRGRLRLLAIIVPILAVPASTMSLGLPVWSAVGAQLPAPVTWAAAFLTVGLSLWSISGMLRVAERFGPGVPSAVRPVARPAVSPA